MANFALVPTDTATYTRAIASIELPEGPPRTDADAPLLATMRRMAKIENGDVVVSHERRSGRNSTDPNDRLGIKYYPMEWTELAQLTAFTFTTAAALAHFAKNVVGTIKDWKDIATTEKRQSTIEVRIGERKIRIQDGDDLEQVIKRIAADQSR